MPDPLVVHLNRDGLYAVEPAATSVEVDGPFEVELRNHGQAVHVHLRPDEDLSRVVRLDATNHFVDTEAVTVVPVRVAAERPATRGTLRVVTGYGSGADVVEVNVSEPRDPDEPTVPVGEDLARPRPDDQPDDGLLPALVRGERPVVLGLVAAALLLAGGTWLVAESLAVLVGVLAVLVGVGVAAYLLLSPRLSR